jgi:hypothetical protein
MISFQMDTVTPSGRMYDDTLVEYVLEFSLNAITANTNVASINPFLLMEQVLFTCTEQVAEFPSDTLLAKIALVTGGTPLAST